MHLHPHPVTQDPQALDVLGVTVELLTNPVEEHAYCIMKGSIPPSMVVPLHSHPDAESFYVVSGRGLGLIERPGRLEWLNVAPGDFFHIPGGAKHAHRNTSSVEPLVELVTTTATLGRFFQEVGRPFESGLTPPTGEDIRRFRAVSARHGHWLASPEENLTVGVML